MTIANFNLHLEFDSVSWDWKSLGFTSQKELDLWRYFNNKNNPNYSGNELQEDEEEVTYID